MFVILKNKREEIKRKKFNSLNQIIPLEEYAEYPILSDFSNYSYDIFNDKSINELLIEFTKISKDDRFILDGEELNELFDMARECEKNSEYLLIFTPFC